MYKTYHFIIKLFVKGKLNIHVCTKLCQLPTVLLNNSLHPENQKLITIFLFCRSKRSTLLSPHSAPADFDSRCEDGISILPTTGNSDYVTVQQASSGGEPPTHFIQNGGYISVNEAKQQLSPANGSYITVSQAKNNAIIV